MIQVWFGSRALEGFLTICPTTKTLVQIVNHNGASMIASTAIEYNEIRQSSDVCHIVCQAMQNCLANCVRRMRCTSSAIIFTENVYVALPSLVHLF
jgi:hypothetical protein